MENENTNKKRVAEPTTHYKSATLQQGKGKDFDFDKALAKGLTIDEAKKLSKTLIEGWWMK